jgi:phosphomethylpyrimidine synthase
MTQLQAARDGVVTPEMEFVAKEEGVPVEQVRAGIADGTIVLPYNVNRPHSIIRAIGKGLKTKVNSNYGSSADHEDLEEEKRKLEASIEYGADSVMDLSTGPLLNDIRRMSLKHSSVMLGTVPIYEAAQKRGVYGFDEAIFDVIEGQAKEGVDYITVHCGVTKRSIARLDDMPRVCGIVSRGGAVTAAYIRKTGRENPLFERYDRLLEIAREHDVTLSLGDGLRPGATADATDPAQLEELFILGELQQRALKAGVQSMVEGPGHVPLDEVAANVQIQKRICHGAPFYVLGPLPTDCGAGYDHITGAIGGAVSAAAGTDMLCYLTPAEHLRLPTAQDVRDGVIATRIAAHCGDVVKRTGKARERDYAMSDARKRLDWEKMFELAFDGKKAREYRQNSEDADKAVCSMCGPLCSVNIDNHTDPQYAAAAAAEHRKMFGQAIVERVEGVPKGTL